MRDAQAAADLILTIAFTIAVLVLIYVLLRKKPS